MNDEYTPHNIRIIRSGLKTYGPVLEKLNLKPFKYHLGSIDPDTKLKIYDYINNKLGTKGLMDLYDEASEKFNIPSTTIRHIYSQERSNKK